MSISIYIPGISLTTVTKIYVPLSFLIRALPPHEDRCIERVLPFVFSLLLPLLLPLLWTACVPFNTETGVYRSAAAAVVGVVAVPARCRSSALKPIEKRTY